MIETIGDKPALQNWSARSADYGIALLEMWAYLADILTFYQERIANEAYLRTAVHEDTVRRLARRLDYEPAPGAAAEALLAFTLEEDTSIQIPDELLVQSVPGQDEQPQKFETIETIAASDGLNAAPAVPAPTRQNLFAAGATRAALAAHSSAAIREAVSEGDRLLIFDESTGHLEEKEVAVFHEQADGRTEIEWTPAVQQAQTNSRVFPFGQTFRLFGYNAPTQAFVVTSDDTNPNGIRTKITPIDDDDTTFRYSPSGTDQTATLRLDTTYDAINAGDLLLIEAGAGLALVTVARVGERPIARLTSSPGNVGTLAAALKDQGAVTELTVKGLGKTITGDRRTALVYRLSPPELSFWLTPTARQQRADDRQTVENLITTIEQRFDLGEPVYESSLYAMIEQGEGSETSNQEEVISSEMQPVMKRLEAWEFDVSRSWELSVGEWIETLRENPNSGWKVPDTISGRKLCMPADANIPVDRLPGRKVFVTGKDRQTNEYVAEPAVIAEVRRRSFGSVAYLQLTLEEVLSHEFQTSSARVFGNVAAATHGETVADEVLGSGSAQADFQSFELAKSPVTYTRAAGAAAGVDNTLELRVDGILWEETERLYDHGGKERIYTTTVDDENVMHVRFGDGEMGARPTTGDRNIMARYRQGLGPAGNVEAHTLETLLDRPKGLSEVTNPKSATGGADRETREATRANAPNTVRTFDRIVSLQDFEDAARGYIGIAKARADWQWEGTRRTVRLVVASDEGRDLSAPEKQNFRAYLDARRDPHRGLQICDFTRVQLTLKLTLQTHEDYRATDVKEAAATAVQEFFAFDDRSLGQDVHQSDLYHLLQNVDGVVAVRIDDFFGSGRSLNSVGRLPIATDELAVLNPQAPQITTASLDR
ncbi:MAG: putative baseplate assembly protein [Spirochaetes bacterium]|nr:putative baseplate assembly protein [Spirochaetota bacterium]